MNAGLLIRPGTQDPHPPSAVRGLRGSRIALVRTNRDNKAAELARVLNPFILDSGLRLRDRHGAPGEFK